MAVTKTSQIGASEKSSSNIAKKNLFDALGFIANSKLREKNPELEILLNTIQERLAKVKAVKITNTDQIRVSKQSDSRYLLQIPKKLAEGSSFIVYHSLLGYFLDKVKAQALDKYGLLELNDFTSALQIESHDTKKFVTERSENLSFEDQVMQILHEGPGPTDVSELAPIEDPSANNIKVEKAKVNMTYVKKLSSVYPKEEFDMVYWRPVAQEMHEALTTNRKEDLSEILTNTLNAFSFIRTRGKTKLARIKDEDQAQYDERVVEKIEADLLRFIVKFINIREHGDASHRPMFIQAVGAIKTEALDKPVSSISFASVLNKFSKAQIDPEAADYDQSNLLAIEDKALSNAPRIAQAATIGAARLGITDQSKGKLGSAVALIGGPEADTQDSPSKKILDLDLNFLEVSTAYGLRFNDFRQGVVSSLKNAIKADDSNLVNYLPSEINQFLDKAIERVSDSETVSPVANEAKELLKLFAEVFESKEIRSLLDENKIQISPTQFFVSQIFLKYFKNDAEAKKDFYMPLLRELEKDYLEFNGVTALIDEAKQEASKDSQKLDRENLKLEIGQLVIKRKEERMSPIAAFAAKKKLTSNAKAMTSLPGLEESDLKAFMRSQDISTFLNRLTNPSLVTKENSLVIDNNLEEYKLDFVELVTGIKPLVTLNSGGDLLGNSVPVEIGGELKLMDKTVLSNLVKATLTRKLMRSVHADTNSDELAKVLPGIENLVEIGSEIYEFLNSRQDLLEVGSAWSSQESEKIKSITEKVSIALSQAKKYKADQTVEISKERAQKLEETVEKSQSAEVEILSLRSELKDLKEVLLGVLSLLAADKKPNAKDLSKLRKQLTDQATTDTVIDLAAETKEIPKVIVSS